MKTLARRQPVLALTLVVLAAISLAPQAAEAQCVSLTTLGVPSTQNFNGLAQTGTNVTWTDNSTIAGWYSTRTTYNAGPGTSNTGSLWSFGVAGTNPVTDRALGGIGSGGTGTFFWAGCFTNNTGATLSSVDIAYMGEQWRDGLPVPAAAQTLAFEYQVAAAGVITDADTPTTGWTAVASLNFTGPIAGTAAAALDGNAAANRVARSGNIPVSVPNGSQIWFRWTDINDASNDHGLAIDDFSVTPQGGGPIIPNLTVTDVSQIEGNAGTTNFGFTVNLSSPAGPGGVTFDITTADNTATTADNDYVLKTLLSQNISAGASTYTFDVTVNGDTTVEANQTFFVNVTNVTGATVVDAQGQGTILNDDVTLTPIHDIQGPGNSSPIVGSSVSTRGVVTGRKSNGFFIQEPNATVDADPATSEGIFVFTSAAPPADAAVGNLVQVTATVVEFVPAADVLQPPMTELSSPTVLLVSPGQPLPTAVPLTATFPDPAGPIDQLERVEGMRVSVASMTVSGPTQGNTNEPNATSTSTGVFLGTVTGVPRPFREPGIQPGDPGPPPIPRWDGNPEVFRVDSDGQVGGGAILDVGVGTVVTGLVGPLDYGFRRYTILPDTTAATSGGPSTTAVTAATGSEITVAAANLERFFDTVNDPGIGEPVLTATAYNNRLNKASQLVRNQLQFPDILGLVEMENLTTVQDLATRINNDAVAASQPNPNYTGFLVEGNDVGGIDVGFLVKTAIVFGTTQRVEVLGVAQELDGTLFTNADSSTETLNDRPPLVLDAIVHHAGGGSYPLVVIVNHMRSLNDVGSEDPGSSGWPTVGARVRAKRLAQAVDLANYVQGRQTSDPTENLILVGDFNAFEFNDGHVDSMNVIGGTPPPDNQTLVPGDGNDLVNPNLTNLFTTVPAPERYSYNFDGMSQSIDHVLVNAPLIASTVARREEHPRGNSDYPAVARNNTAVPNRISDHDPMIAYLQIAGFATSDLSVTKTDGTDPVVAGTNFAYTITVINDGPDPAAGVTMNDTLPAGTTFASLASPAGWSCTTPAIGAGGTVSCSRTSDMPVGSEAFTLIVNVAASTAAGTILSNTATVATTTADPDTADHSATATTTVSAVADLSITKTDSPDPVLAGTNLTYTITVTNDGASNAATVAWSDTLPVGTTFVSLPAVAGWSCTTPAVGAGGLVNCSIASMPVTASVFTLTVQVGIGVAGGTVFSNTATLTSGTTDPDSGDLSATATTTVTAPSADLSITKTDTPDPVLAGNNLTYTITVTNAGPQAATNASWSDTLPAGTTFVSISAVGGWGCTTPAVGATGTVTCSATSMAVGTAAWTLVVQVQPSTLGVITNTATATSATSDPDSGDLSATATTTANGSSDISVTKTASNPTPLPGDNVIYTITVTNGGPSTAANATLSDPLPTAMTFVTISPVSGWSCTTPAVGVTGLISCSNPAFGPGTAVFNIEVEVEPSTAVGTVLDNTVTVGSATTDPDNTDLTATASVTVSAAGSANVTATKSVEGPLEPGSPVVYVVVLENAGPGAQADDPTSDEMVDVLPLGLTLVDATATSGAAVASVGTNTVTWNGSIPAGGTVTIVINAIIDADVPPGTVIENQATYNYDSDGDGENDTTGVSDDPDAGGDADPTTFVVGGAPIIEVPTLDLRGLLALVALIAGAAMFLLRR